VPGRIEGNFTPPRRKPDSIQQDLPPPTPPPAPPLSKYTDRDGFRDFTSRKKFPRNRNPKARSVREQCHRRQAATGKRRSPRRREKGGWGGILREIPTSSAPQLDPPPRNRWSLIPLVRPSMGIRPERTSIHRNLREIREQKEISLRIENCYIVHCMSILLGEQFR
jgi:hypothetical protein